MKTFLLILLITFQSPSKEYSIFRRCNGENKACREWPASMTITNNYILLKNNDAELKLWIVNCMKDAGKQYYMLGLDSLASDQTTYKLYRGSCVIEPQIIPYGSDTPLTSRIFLEIIDYADSMKVYRAYYHYSKIK